MNVLEVYSPSNMLILFLEWKVLIMFFFSVHVSYMNLIDNRFLNAVKVCDIYESTD